MEGGIPWKMRAFQLPVQTVQQIKKNKVHKDWSVELELETVRDVKNRALSLMAESV